MHACDGLDRIQHRIDRRARSRIGRFEDVRLCREAEPGEALRLRDAPG